VSTIANAQPGWGYRKVYNWLRAQGKRWNYKRVARVYRALKLNLRIRPRKRLPNGLPPHWHSRLLRISAGQWIS